MTVQELSQKIQVSISSIETNFPDVAVTQAKKGILLKRIGRGQNKDYTIELIQPQILPKEYFTQHKTKKVIYDNNNLPNEQWVDCYLTNEYEVSNMGRIRDKKSHRIYQGFTDTKKGYQQISIKDKTYFAHRVILQSWLPKENLSEWTVEHKNGIRSDNRLENLEWKTIEDNVQQMIFMRGEMNKELTRIIQKFGYDKTLQILQKL